MVKEGVGEIAPSPRPVLIGEDEMRCILLGVKELSRYGKRSDAWGKGLLGNTTTGLLAGLPSHERPIVAGKCGEYAVWRVLNEWFPRRIPPVDFSRRMNGDDGIDLRAGNAELQIKTRVKPRKNNLVKSSEGNAAIPVFGDLYVFCEWFGDHWVRVLGWMPARQVAVAPTAAGLGRWDNYVIADAKLLPMVALKADLDWRMGS